MEVDDWDMRVECAGVYDPGDEVPFVVRFRELAATEHTLHVVVRLFEGQDLVDVVSVDDRTLGPGQELSFPAVVDLPLGADAGGYAVTVRAGDGSVVGRDHCTFEVLAHPPGGFVEHAFDVGPIDRLVDEASLGALLPAAGGSFSFPAPYGTEAIRLTDDASCGGTDCVRYVGYSYWRNINAHRGRSSLLVFLSLDETVCGGGLTVFDVDKATLGVTNRGNPLIGTGLGTNPTAEGYYFSGSLPTALYVHDWDTLLRLDVDTGVIDPVVDVTDHMGDGHYLWQHHTSDDDIVHSFTVRLESDFSSIGCAVYDEVTGLFELFATLGGFDECQVDKSGRWLTIKENVDGLEGEDDRVIDLTTGVETILLDEDGGPGHSDAGYGVMVGADNWAAFGGTHRVWDLADLPGSGGVVYVDTSWNTLTDHVSFGNARPDVPVEDQYACSSRIGGDENPRQSEIVCYPLDGSLDVLVVAPVMGDLTSPGGGDEYARAPKGNLDVTGRWFVWTTNLYGDRLDAFLVRVPGHLLDKP